MALVQFPNNVRIIQLNIGLLLPYQTTNVGIYTGQRETITHGGGYWTGSLLFEPIRYDQELDKSTELESFISSTEGIANEFDVPINYRISRGSIPDGSTYNTITSSVAGAYTSITFEQRTGSQTSTPLPGVIRQGDYFNIETGPPDARRMRLMRAERDSNNENLLATPAIRGITAGEEIIVTRLNQTGQVLNYPFLRSNRADTGAAPLTYTAGNMSEIRLTFVEVV